MMIKNYYISKDSIDWRLLFIFSLVLLEFFGLAVIPNYRNLYAVFVWCSIMSSIFLYKKDIIYGKSFVLLNLFILINALGCLQNRDQNVFATYRGEELLTLSSINFYFFFSYLKIRIHKYEKILLYLSIIFCILYIIQYFIYPTILFKNTVHILNNYNFYDGAEARIRATGQALGPIAFFMGFNKFLKTKKIIYIIQMLLGGSVVVMLGFRTQIFTLVLFTIILIYRYYHLSLKTIIYVVLLFLIFLFLIDYVSFIQSTFQQMAERQESGSSFEVRYITLNYYYTQFFINNWELVFGAGLPGPGSSYSDIFNKLNDTGIIYADCGILGLSWIAGIPVVVIIISYPIMSFFRKVPKDFLYIGVVLMFMLVSSTFTREIYRIGNPYLFGMLLAIQEKLKKYN